MARKKWRFGRGLDLDLAPLVLDKHHTLHPFGGVR